MTAQAPAEAHFHPWRIRPAVWGICALALITALLVPMTDLWQTWQAPVVVQISLDTAQPKLGQMVHLVVTLHQETAGLAKDTPLHVTLDMHGMPMYFPTMQVPAEGAQYLAALPFSMRGQWDVDLHLQLPAHAPWHRALHVQVGSDGTAGGKS
jgi:hypothetical protein